MNVLLLAGLWIAICLVAARQWWKVRTRALAVRFYLEAEDDPNPQDLRLARFRVVSATFWFMAGVAGAIVGLLVILDMAPSIRTLLMFAGPVILAAMGWQQDRHERALMLRSSQDLTTSSNLSAIRTGLDDIQEEQGRVSDNLKHAQSAVDDLAEDVDASRKRADAVDPGEPGEAADAASRSDVNGNREEATE